MTVANADVRQDDTGTVFKFTVYDDGEIVDLSSAVALKIYFRKKNKTVFSVDAELFTNGSDGIITYTSGSADFDQSGDWFMQVYVETPTGHWRSDMQKFVVGEIIA